MAIVEQNDRFSPIDSQAPSHWTEAIGKNENCPNCGVLFVGNYCAECGQKRLVERLKFGQLANKLFSEISNVERGLLHTFLDLMRQPGAVIRDYVSGRQRPYVNPLSYFLVGTAAQLISFVFTSGYIHEQLRTQLSTAFAQQPQEFTDNLRKVFDDPAAGFADCYVASIQQAYTYAALFCFCLPFAMLLMVGHRLLGEKYRMGETTVFSLYTFAQMLIITAVLTPLTLWLAPGLQPLIALGTYIVYPLHAHTGFFQRTWTSRCITIFATVLSTVVFVSSIMAIFAATLIITVILKSKGF